MRKGSAHVGPFCYARVRVRVRVGARGAATVWVLGAFECFYALHSGCTWIGSGYMDRLCVCG